MEEFLKRRKRRFGASKQPLSKARLPLSKAKEALEDKKQKTPSGELGEKCVCEKVFINEQLI